MLALETRRQPSERRLVRANTQRPFSEKGINPIRAGVALTQYVLRTQRLQNRIRTLQRNAIEVLEGPARPYSCHFQHRVTRVLIDDVKQAQF